jgi:hypothetical protein
MTLVHTSVGLLGEVAERSWNATDALLYALGVGAGLGHPARELKFTTEDGVGGEQRVLPTFGVILASRRSNDLGIGVVRQRVERPRVGQVVRQHPDRRLDMAAYATAHDGLGRCRTLCRRSTPAPAGAVAPVGRHGPLPTRVARSKTVMISLA